MRYRSIHVCLAVLVATPCFALKKLEKNGAANVATIGGSTCKDLVDNLAAELALEEKLDALRTEARLVLELDAQHKAPAIDHRKAERLLKEYKEYLNAKSETVSKVLNNFGQMLKAKDDHSAVAQENIIRKTWIYGYFSGYIQKFGYTLERVEEAVELYEQAKQKCAEEPESSIVSVVGQLIREKTKR